MSSRRRGGLHHALSDARRIVSRFGLDGCFEFIERGQNAPAKLRQALSRHRRDLQYVASCFFAEAARHGLCFGQFAFGDDDEFRALEQPRIIKTQLVPNGRVVGHRIGPVGRTRFHQMHQHPGAFDVPQKLVSQSDADMGPFDEAGDVGHHELAIVADTHHAQMRMPGGEGIGGDAGLGPGKSAQKGRFAGVRFADQTHVGEQLQFQQDFAFLPGMSLFELAGGLMGGRGEVLVAVSAASTPSHDHLVAVADEILQQVATTGVPDQCAERNPNDRVGTASAGLQLALSMSAAFGLPVSMAGQMAEAGDVAVGTNDDVAAVAAVAAVRPTARNVRLPPEAEASVSAVTGFAVKRDLVDEHGFPAIVYRLLTAMGTRRAWKTPCGPAHTEKSSRMLAGRGLAAEALLHAGWLAVRSGNLTMSIVREGVSRRFRMRDHLPQFRRWIVATGAVWAAVAIGLTGAIAHIGKAAFAQTDDVDTVLVRVNGQPITQAELELAKRVRGLSGRLSASRRRALLEQLVDERLMRDFLAQRKSVPDSELLDEQVERLKAMIKRRGDDPEKVLARLGYDDRRLRDAVALPLAWQAFIGRTVTESDIEKYFEKHRAQFDGTQVRARHIFLKLAADADENDIAEAKKRLETLKRRIETGELSFEAAAREVSQAPSATQGGDVGWFPYRGKMPKAFAETAFQLDVGAVSEPVRTPFGLHLIQVTERKPGRLQLEDARQDVLNAIAGKLWQETVRRLREQARIEWNTRSGSNGAT